MTLRVKYNEKKDSYMIQEKRYLFFWFHIVSTICYSGGFGYDKWWFDDKKAAEEDMIKMLFEHNAEVARKNQLIKEDKENPIQLSSDELVSKHPDIHI